MDRARFPRVKLCAGWISTPIWDVLELSPRAYPCGLWEWNRCHVAYRGQSYTVDAHGYFIRRYELDDFLLGISGAELALGSPASHIEQDRGEWIVNGTYRSTYLIGAGGTHCPVARTVHGARPERPVGVQEHEFAMNGDTVAAHRIGADGEPELLLHDDLGGYSWNVAKSEWLNIGSGTRDARQVRAAWQTARAHFTGTGHVPAAAQPELDRMKGHSYYLFCEHNLDACERDRAFVIGDALGLAQPLTAEGILPAVLSGRLAAEAILAGEPGRYRRALMAHPIIADYRLLRRLRDAGTRLRRPGATSGAHALPAPIVRLGHRALARGFAWMFSGKRLPGGGLLGRVVDRVSGRVSGRISGHAPERTPDHVVDRPAPE